MAKNKCKDCEDAFKDVSRKGSHEAFFPFKNGTILITACRKHIKQVTDIFKKYEKLHRN